MLPVNSIYDHRHHRIANAEVSGDSHLHYTSRSQSTNLAYLLFGKLSHATTFTLGASALRCRVLTVVAGRSLEQVFRVTARWIIAGVANPLCGPIAFNKEKGKSMGSVLSGMYRNLAVSCLDRSPLPFPTVTLWALSRRLIDVAPKQLDLLRGKLRRVYSNLSHVSLLNRLIRLGSFGCIRTRSSRLHFSTFDVRGLEYLERFWRGGFGRAYGFRCEVDK